MEVTDVPAALPAVRQPKPRIRWAGFVFSVVGFWLSLNLLQLAGTPPGARGVLEALCEAGARGAPDCRSVLNSQWGYVRLGSPEGGMKLPVSALGMGYFAYVALWYLLVGPPTRARWFYHLPLLLPVLYAAWQSVSFVAIMALKLHQWCTWCLLVHAVNAGLLALTIAAFPWRKARGTRPAPHPTWRLAVASFVAAGLAFCAPIAAAIAYGAGESMGKLSTAYRKIVEDPEYVLWNHRRQPLVTIPLREDDAFAGSPSAPNTAVIFSDFQCPQCRKAHDALAKLAHDHPEQLRVVDRHFPQDPTCNPAYAVGGHPAACRAARACEAARIVGGPAVVTAIADLLYKRQSELELNRYAKWAGELGLDVAAFDAAMDSAAASARVAEDVELGRKLGLSGLPAVYYNGRRLEGWSNPRIWDELLGRVPGGAGLRGSADRRRPRSRGRYDRSPVQTPIRTGAE